MIYIMHFHFLLEKMENLVSIYMEILGYTVQDMLQWKIKV